MTQGSLQQHVVGLLEFWFSGEFLNSRKQGAPCLLGWTALQAYPWPSLWSQFTHSWPPGRSSTRCECWLCGASAPLLWVVLWQHFFPGLLDCTFSAV